MNKIVHPFLLLILIVTLTMCSDDVVMMEEEMEENPMDTTEMMGLEPIGIDTNSLTPCNPDMGGPFENGSCRIAAVYNITETVDPITGDTSVMKSVEYPYVYNELDQLNYYEGVGFRDSITFLPDGSISQVIRRVEYDFEFPPGIATYYYDSDGLIDHIKYDQWQGDNRVDSFYYNDNHEVIRIKEWSTKDDGALDRLLHDFSYDYYDKGLLRRYQHIRYECVDYCEDPITTLLYFWNYTDFKPIILTHGFHHDRKVPSGPLPLNIWVYEYIPDEIWGNSGQEIDLSTIEHNEYGYVTNPYFEWECFP